MSEGNDTDQFKMQVNEALDPTVDATPLSPLKSYVGTKLLMAEPMTRGEYNQHRSWVPPEGEPQDVAGFHVIYPGGYESWSPKPQFVEAYLELGDISGLALHQVRVIAEKTELDAKIVKLSKFIGDRSPVFLGLDVAEQTRLVMQHTIMRQYSDLLGQRIATFQVQL